MWRTLRNASFGGLLSIAAGLPLLADMLPGSGGRPHPPYPLHVPPGHPTPLVPDPRVPHPNIPVPGARGPRDITVLIGLVLALMVIAAGVWWVRRRRKYA